MEKQELKDYIVKRIEALKNKNDYDYGFTSREDIVGGLNELRIMANRFRIDVSPVWSFNVPDWLK